MVKPKQFVSKRFFVLLIILASLGSMVFYSLLKGSKLQSDRIVFRGTVEKYDITPSFTDGPIAFVVDGRFVDIGGGLRGQQSLSGTFDEKAQKVGAKVEVRARVDRSGGDEYLTIYGCNDCYVKTL